MEDRIRAQTEAAARAASDAHVSDRLAAIQRDLVLALEDLDSDVARRRRDHDERTRARRGDAS